MSPDSRITPVPLGKATFLDSPRCEDLSKLDADVAILGVPFGYPYDLSGLTSPSASAPEALREASGWYAAAWRDFKKITQQELADEVGSSRGQVSDLETGSALVPPSCGREAVAASEAAA